MRIEAPGPPWGACRARWTVAIASQGIAVRFGLWATEATAMHQLFNQLIQFVQQGIAAIFRFVQLIWNWSVEQILRVLDAPWQNWPFWKQIMLVLIAAGVVWAL